jgi:uncharacterized protein (TIGR00251 family)
MAGLPSFVRPHAEGFTIAIKVTPRAPRNQVGPVRGDELVVKVTAPPVDAKANEAVIALIASKLGIAASRIELIRGQTSRSKVLLARVTAEQVSRLHG